MLEKLRSQSLLLDPTYKTQKLKENPRRHKKLSAKQKRAIKLYNIPEEQQRFVKDKGGGGGGGGEGCMKISPVCFYLTQI